MQAVARSLHCDLRGVVVAVQLHARLGPLPLPDAAARRRLRAGAARHRLPVVQIERIRPRKGVRVARLGEAAGLAVVLLAVLVAAAVRATLRPQREWFSPSRTNAGWKLRERLRLRRWGFRSLCSRTRRSQSNRTGRAPAEMLLGLGQRTAASRWSSLQAMTSSGLVRLVASAQTDQTSKLRPTL